MGLHQLLERIVKINYAGNEKSCIFDKQYKTMKNTMDKQTEQFYQEALKQFKGDEKAMMEYFKKVLDYQKNKK